MRPEDVGIGRLFHGVRDAVILADAETQQIRLWNVAAADMFGYSTSEALGLRIEALIPERLKARHREGIARYAETGHGAYVDSHNLLELPALTKSGEEISIELSLSPMHDIPGVNERRFVLAIIRDVTERKNARSPSGERAGVPMVKGALHPSSTHVVAKPCQGHCLRVEGRSRLQHGP